VPTAALPSKTTRSPQLQISRTTSGGLKIEIELNRQVLRISCEFSGDEMDLFGEMISRLTTSHGLEQHVEIIVLPRFGGHTPLDPPALPCVGSFTGTLLTVGMQHAVPATTSPLTANCHCHVQSRENNATNSSTQFHLCMCRTIVVDRSSAGNGLGLCSRTSGVERWQISDNLTIETKLNLQNKRITDLNLMWILYFVVMCLSLLVYSYYLGSNSTKTKGGCKFFYNSRNGGSLAMAVADL